MRGLAAQEWWSPFHSFAAPCRRPVSSPRPPARRILHSLQLFQAPEDRPAPCTPWQLAQAFGLVSQPAGSLPIASLSLNVQEESDGPLIFLRQAMGQITGCPRSAILEPRFRPRSGSCG